MTEFNIYMLFGTICTIFGYVGCKFFNYAWNIRKFMVNGTLLYDKNNKPINSGDMHKCFCKTKTILFNYLYIGLGILICPSLLFVSYFNSFITYLYTVCIGAFLTIIVNMCNDINRKQLRRYGMLTIIKKDNPVKIK